MPLKIENGNACALFSDGHFIVTRGSGTSLLILHITNYIYIMMIKVRVP